MTKKELKEFRIVNKAFVNDLVDQLDDFLEEQIESNMPPAEILCALELIKTKLLGVWHEARVVNDFENTEVLE